MARKPQVSVEPRPNGRWAVQTDETQRADSLHEKKSQSVARGRELAGNKRASSSSRTNAAGSPARIVTATIRAASRDELAARGRRDARHDEGARLSVLCALGGRGSRSRA